MAIWQLVAATGDAHNDTESQVNKTEAPAVMNNMQELHAERLREALEFIKVIREKNITALDNEFQIWKEEVQQSFSILFGKDHGCTNRFRELDFWLIRADCGGGIYWSRIDRGILNKDLLTAEEIISGALEELSARG